MSYATSCGSDYITILTSICTSNQEVCQFLITQLQNRYIY